MINSEKLNRLYEVSINGELTTKELNSYGLNSKDITKLINEGIIIRIERGHYDLLDFKGLYTYGQELMRNKEREKAIKCYKKVFDFDDKNRVSFVLFLNSIYTNDYEEAFKYFKVLYTAKNIYLKADCNLYLYLLSYITEVPQIYQNIVKNMEISDIKVNADDRRYSDIASLNKSIAAAFQQKFSYALKLLNDFGNAIKKLPITLMLVKFLLKQAINIEQKTNKILKEMAQNKEYEQIIEFLENKEKNHNLGWVNSYVLVLAKDAIKISKTKEVPEIKDLVQDNIFTAIDAYNYELALSLNEEYNKKLNISTDNVLSIMLKNMCEIIKQIKLEKQHQNLDISESNDEEIEVFKVEDESVLEIPKTPDFIDIIKYLMNNELEKAKLCINALMISRGKEEYLFLINDLINLSLLENDIAYTKPMHTLMKINNGNYKFNIQEFIENFYIALSQNKFKEARIYLNIISNCHKLGNFTIMTEGLLQILENAEKIIKSKSHTIDYDDKINEDKNIKKLKLNEEVVSEESVEIDKTKEQIMHETLIENNSSISNSGAQEYIPRDSDREFIQRKFGILEKEHGIIILNPMTKERRKKIYDIANKFPNLDAFSIGEGNVKQIVLRYKYFDKNKNYNELLSLAKNAYYEKKYTECINYYLELMTFSYVKPFIYAKLGMAYLKNGNKLKAIDYFTVATELSKNDPKPFDFKDLITTIECGMMPKDEQKPNFEIKPSFFNNSDHNFDIPNFDQINNLAIELNLDIESTCEKLGMSNEQICLVKILYAIRYYTQGNYKQGDMFIKAVEQTPNKSLKVIKALEEVKAKKKFYTYRAKEESKVLKLNIKPN